MPSVRTRPVWLVPAVLLASSFGLVCSSNPGTTPQTSPTQPSPAIVIPREIDAEESLVFPPKPSREARLPLRAWDVDRDAGLAISSPYLDSQKSFSFHGTSFQIGVERGSGLSNLGTRGDCTGFTASSTGFATADLSTFGATYAAGMAGKAAVGYINLKRRLLGRK